MRKIMETSNPLSNTIKDTSTIMRNPSLHSSDKGLRMIVLVSLIVLLRGLLCFHDFSHGASLHPCSFNGMIFALVYIYIRYMYGIQRKKCSGQKFGTISCSGAPQTFSTQTFSTNILLGEWNMYVKLHCVPRMYMEFHFLNAPLLRFPLQFSTARIIYDITTPLVVWSTRSLHAGALCTYVLCELKYLAVGLSFYYGRTSLPKVYLTSPEPSRICYNFLILHPIIKTLTPLESSQFSALMISFTKHETLPVQSWLYVP